MTNPPQASTPCNETAGPNDLWNVFLQASDAGANSVTRRARDGSDLKCDPQRLQDIACRLAAQLAAAGAGPGDVLMVVNADPMAFVTAFWAGQAAGMAVAPMPAMNSAAQAQRTRAALSVLGGAWVLGERAEDLAQLADAPEARGIFRQTGQYFDRIEHAPETPPLQPLQADPEAISVVMFSSGSTGDPKGVELSHRAILAQVDIITSSINSVPGDRFVSWLPLSHDFGLFHFHLMPILSGQPQLLLAAEDFARRPISWLRALSEFNGTVTGSSNLALQLVLSLLKPERAAALDLTGLRCLVLGAEPLDPDLMRRFVDRLTPSGLSAEALCPAYGLAEATLLATMRQGLSSIRVDRQTLEVGARPQPLTEDTADSVELPLLGKPTPQVTLRVVDDNRQPLPDGVTGHLELRSPAMMRGYINRPEATAAALHGDGWLATGDIGFLMQGEFVMAGRAKDLVISGGRNFHPADLERVAEAAPGLPAGSHIGIAQTRDPQGSGSKIVAFLRFRGPRAQLPAAREAILTHLAAQTGVALDHIVLVSEFPRTTSGKLRRHALAQDFERGAFADTPEEDASDRGAALRGALATRDQSAATQVLCEAASQVIGVPIEPRQGLFDQGLSSRQAVAFCALLGGWLGRRLSVARLFDYPAPSALADWLIQRGDAGDAHIDAPGESGAGSQSAKTRLAVIGFGCRLPGGETPEAFWDFLCAPRPLAAPVPPERWETPASAQLPPATLLPDIDSFAPDLFGLSRAEAEAMNPVQRLLLAVLFEALEHAGLDPARLRGQRVGLFVGLSESGLATGRGEILSDPDALPAYAVTGSAGSVAVGRMAHIFDFRGPALAIDTACSSSLVALDLASQSLRNGECDIAIAGGANLILSPDLHAALQGMGALSPDGLCKTFSAEADGYGRGEGAALVVLRPMDAALSAGDRICAELCATAVNHDGQSQSVTAPNGIAQRGLLRQALATAGLQGGDLDWVEAHGTGTALGDPIELAALADVLRSRGGAALPVGALKSRIGHLEAAAGIAGVIKLLLSLEHDTVPADTRYSVPTEGFADANGQLTPIHAPFAWSRTNRPRRAGVASFGMSGTNAYAILAGPEAAASGAAQDLAPRPMVLPLAVNDAPAATCLRAEWADLLNETPQTDWPALAAGQASRRLSGPLRCALPLDPSAPLSERPFKATRHASRLIFVFPGQGAQRPQMGRVLYEAEPAFRAAFDAAAEAAELIDGRGLADWLYGADPADATRMNETDLAQPALVAYGHAMHALWAEFGVLPDAVLGHSVGEIGAALAAGVFDLGTAMQLAVRRGRVMRDLAGPGAMLAVSATRADLETLYAGLPDVHIAGENGPRAFTLAGSEQAITLVQTRAKAASCPCRKLEVSRAFHSPAMQRAADALFDGYTVATAKPVLTVYSTLTGGHADPDFANSDYWHAQMQAPVRFGDAVNAAAGQGSLFVELGAGETLTRMGPASAPESAWIGGTNCPQSLASALGDLWTEGAAVDWPRYFGGRGAPGDRLPRHPRNTVTLARRPARMRDAQQPAVPAVHHASVPATFAANTVETAELATADTRLQTDILPLIARISGIDPADIPPDGALVGLGIDSLAMVQLQRALTSQLDLTVDLQALFNGVETPRKLAALLAERQPAPQTVSPADPSAAVVAATESLPALFQAQLKLVGDMIAGQLSALQGETPNMAVPATALAQPTPAARPSAPVQGGVKGLFGASRQDQTLKPHQAAHLAELTRIWNARSPGSKSAAATARPHVANSRAVFGFSTDFKELTYPLMAKAAQGARVRDVDGNDYIDVTMGFGTYLFGHKPDFVTQALHDELDSGAAIGPATPLAEDVANRIHALTGVDRCAFFSTGTEAIMCAVRIARAVTGREKIVIFRGAYHGSFDGVLATGWVDPDGTPQAAPLTEGTPQAMIDPVIVLDYGDMAGLDVIARHANQIALVLVEPVQSRNPENRPVEFLRALRTLTQDRDVPLLFDEIISGFRFAPGGMQQIWGIEADLVTYGKVLANGLPIGVLAGQARFMDAVDGGQWRYGDDSAPGARTAFVAGTFNGHPLALRAASAVLERIAEDDGQLQEALAARTEAMCQRLDALFQAEDVPVRMSRFGSLFRFEYGPGAEILNTHLLANGVFVWEQRNCFLSTAHDDTAVEQIIAAARTGVEALKKAGWFSDTPPLRDAPPLSAGETAMRRRAADALPGTWTDVLILRLGSAGLEPQRVAAAWRTLCARHPALRACLAADGTRHMADAAMAPFEHLTLPDAAALERWADAAIHHPFALTRAPLRLSLIDMGEQALALTSSHLCFDGWSLALLLSELSQLLGGETLEPVSDPALYEGWEAGARFHRLPNPPMPVLLPADGPAPSSVAPRGARLTRAGLGPLYDRLCQSARVAGITPLALCMAPFVAMLGALSGQRRISVAVPVSGQALSDCLNLVGNLSFLRPVTAELEDTTSLVDLAQQLHAALLEPGQQPPLDQMPERHVLFNVDGPIALSGPLKSAQVQPAPIRGARADVFCNLLRLGEDFVLDLDWNADRFSEDWAGTVCTAYLALLERLTDGTPTVADAATLLPKGMIVTDPPTAAPITASADEDAVAARALDPTETRLAAIWSDLLGQPVVSPNADFFALGGGSLQAVRLIGRISESFGCKLSMARIFAAPVLAEMAASLTAEAEETGPPEAFDPSAPIPALPQQEQLRLLEESTQAGAAYNLALRLDFAEPLDPAALGDALVVMTARHASLRLGFEWTEDGLRLMPGARAHAPQVDRLETSDEAVQSFVDRPFDIAEGNLWRIGCCAGGTSLILVLHHIISDAWSMEIFSRDLIDAYQRSVLQIPPARPLDCDFPLHAARIAAGHDDQSRALTFWREQLAGAPALTALPGDKPRPACKSYEGSKLSRRLPDALTRALRETAQGLRSSPFQMVVTAIAAMTANRLDRDDIVLGTVSAGRAAPGAEDAIGFYANMLPLRLRPEKSDSGRTQLDAARAALTAIITHDCVSLQQIAAACGQASDASANPFFEVCVTHDDRHGLTQLCRETSCIFTEIAPPSSQFDLSFYLIENGGELMLDVTYAVAIHERASMDAMLDTVLDMLHQLCRDPDAPLVGAGTDQTRNQTPTARQARLWFVDRFESGVLYDGAPSYYNMAGRYAAKDMPTPEQLAARLGQIPANKLCFAENGGLPTRLLVEPKAPQCAALDEDAIDAFIDTPFALDQGGLMRIGLVGPKTRPELLLVAHHSLCEPEALDQIAAWLLEGGANPPALSAMTAVDADPQTKELAFWQDHLGANPPRLLLPTDHPRAAVHVYRRGGEVGSLDPATTAALEAAATRADMTLDDALMGAFAVLLHRLSGQDEIVLGLTEGPNLVTLRAPLGPDMRSDNALRTVAAHARRARANAVTAFDQVVLDLKPDNDMSRTALFDVLFVKDDTPDPRRQSPAVTGWGKYDLVLAPLRRADGGLTLGLSCNREMFDPATSRNWMRMLEQLLHAFAEDGSAETPLGRLPLLSDQNLPQALAAAAPRRTPSVQDGAPLPRSLPAAVLHWAGATPKVAALIEGTVTLDYAGLVQNAEALAGRLAARGVQPGDRVAIMLPRAAEYVQAMMAVMMAGAAFVPLDAQAAPGRTKQILADAMPRLVLTNADLAEQLPPESPLWRIEDAMRADAVADTLPDITPDMAAYVIFTSGSTGRPKGVVVEHRNVLALVCGQGDLFPISAGDRWSWFHSPAFDFAVWEIWGALLTGGCAVVMPEEARRDFSVMRAELAQHRVTQLSMTPSAFQALQDVEMRQPDNDLAVTAIWFGGEALVPSTLRPWAGRYPGCHLLNLFGITETTVHVTYRPITASDLDRTDSPIGRPLPSYGLSLRDAGLRPLPPGVQGEIVVSGSGVARGYLGQPDLTAERFVDDPYAPGTRLYRSGDLGRIGPDGELTYLGRADTQVKLRGYRIELGEVESALRGLPGVRDAAAALLGDGQSEAVLAGWLVGADKMAPEVLDAHLTDALPAYMLPRRLFGVAAIPLTNNGKIDRDALVQAIHTPIGVPADVDPPRPGLETKIAEILCVILERSEIGRRESFFTLGGHSLMANRAVLRLRAKLGLTLTLRDFFAAPTVAGLAAIAGVASVPAEMTEAGRITRQPEADSYPLSSSQARLFAMQSAAPDSAAYNMVGGFLVDGEPDRRALEWAFVDLISRHEILRTRFALVQGEPRQIVEPAPERFDLFEAAIGPEAGAERDEDRIRRALSQEFLHVFDLDGGPLLRVGLGRLRDGRWLLVMNMHHIIADGWSVPILFKDLSDFYQARIDGGQAALDPLPIQYRDFAFWQQNQPAAPILDAALRHWRARGLQPGEAAAPLTSLPSDHPRRPQRAGQGAIKDIALDQATTDALRAELARRGLTLFTAASAALHMLLRLRGDGDNAPTVIGTADAGRDALETEGQLGFYLNLLPHVLDVPADAPIESWLTAAADETGAMLGHKTVPFDRMLDALNIQPQPGHTPAFDILLIVQNNGDAGARLGPHALKALPDDSVTARYDLNLWIEDRAEMKLVLEYDRALFDAETMDWLLDDLQALLRAMAQTPERNPAQVLGAGNAAQAPTRAEGLLAADDPLLGGL